MSAITIDLTHEVLEENIRAVSVNLTPDDLRDINYSETNYCGNTVE